MKLIAKRLNNTAKRKNIRKTTMSLSHLPKTFLVELINTRYKIEGLGYAPPYAEIGTPFNIGIVELVIETLDE